MQKLITFLNFYFFELESILFSASDILLVVVLIQEDPFEVKQRQRHPLSLEALPTLGNSLTITDISFWPTKYARTQYH